VAPPLFAVKLDSDSAHDADASTNDRWIQAQPPAAYSISDSSTSHSTGARSSV
jgi:hypothetical protein